MLIYGSYFATFKMTYLWVITVIFSSLKWTNLYKQMLSFALRGLVFY